MEADLVRSHMDYISWYRASKHTRGLSHHPGRRQMLHEHGTMPSVTSQHKEITQRCLVGRLWETYPGPTEVGYPPSSDRSHVKSMFFNCYNV